MCIRALIIESSVDPPSATGIDIRASAAADGNAQFAVNLVTLGVATHTYASKENIIEKNRGHIYTKRVVKSSLYNQEARILYIYVYVRI